MKKVLVLCTGNSCRSIMAEGLINKYLAPLGIRAFSAGAAPSGRVHPMARKILEQEGAWRDEYRSKSIEEALEHGPFDLTVTVCDNAQKACPALPGVATIHVGFKDPDGHPYEAFEATREAIKSDLLPKIAQRLAP